MPSQFNFTPPQIESTPSVPNNSNGSFNSAPNGVNTPAASEKVREIQRSVVKSRQVRSVTTAVINSREEFVEFLRKNGMDLLTSWVDFNNTKDFILSSTVIFQNGASESLADFLKRYSELAQPVMKIRDSLKGV
jgi:CTP:phosphocholine cytidylyltransferase-like protein